MQNLNVTFENRKGEMLSGILDLPTEEPVAYALFAHCFTCSKNLRAASNIARALNDERIAVLRFDFTGLGQSAGEFANTNFSTNVDDLLAAVDFLDRKHGDVSILIGHSLGGTAVLQAAPRVESAVAVATIGSPAEPAHVARMFASHEESLREQGEAEVDLGGRPFLVKQQFVDDLEEHDVQGTIGKLRKALLIMHAPLDNIVEIDNAAELFVAAKHPKSFVSLDSADHLLSNDDDSRYAGQVLAAWASRYVPHADHGEPFRVAAGEVVARTYTDGFKTDVRAGRHTLVADEPRSVGGTNAGPSPYDLLSASLATCTSMTLHMYAAHKKLDLESVTVRVKHGKIHAVDCEDCESDSGRIDEFQRSISLQGDLNEQQRQRILEIADRCPVHRTLEGEIKVRSKLD